MSAATHHGHKHHGKKLPHGVDDPTVHQPQTDPDTAAVLAQLPKPTDAETAFFTRVLHLIGAPVTLANLIALHAWRTGEGSSATWNFLDTTQAAPGASNFNSVGVKNYPDMETGARATAETLLNGRYPHIVAALRKGTNPYDVANQLDELHVWGTGSLIKTVLDQWVQGVINSSIGKKLGAGGVASVLSKAWHNPVTGAIGDAAGAVGGAVGDAAGAVADVAVSVPHFLAKLADPSTWIRVAYVIGGMALIAIGAFMLADHDLIGKQAGGAVGGAVAGKALDAALVA